MAAGPARRNRMAQTRPDFPASFPTPIRSDVASTPTTDAGSPFRSFWMGGYEGADHLNAHGVPLDMARRTGHTDRLDEDYARAVALGLGTVRESIGWRLTETRTGGFDFTRLRTLALTAQRHRVQVLWTLMHYGTPPDVSLLDDGIVERFAHYAAAVAETLAPLSAEPPVYNLVNEIGFLAWATSETSLIHPYRRDLEASGAESTESSGYEVKRRLARAVLAGIDAIRRIDPRARFLHVEPLVHVVAPRGRPDLEALAEQVSGYQWQAWDLIAGRVEPELGGSLAALDCLGVNHYHSGQWEVKTENRLWWHLRDPRRRALSALLEDAWRRYRRPLIVAETGHVGAGRAAWLHETAAEVEKARRRGVPVGGICLYPLIDRPDWNDLHHWHHSGLWNVEATAPSRATGESAVLGEPAVTSAQPSARRLLHLEYAEAMTAWRARLPGAGSTATGERLCLIAAAPRRWDSGRGRFQQLMMQLARDRRVLVVEAPLACDAASGIALEPRLDRRVGHPGLEILVPHIPRASARTGAIEDDDAAWAVAAGLVARFLAAEDIDDPDLWLTSPRALALLGPLRPRAVVYDCASLGGEAAPALAAGSHRALSAAGATTPPGQRDAALLEVADIVVTRSPGLQERLARLHADVHWLPDAVDTERFRPAGLCHDSEEGQAVRRAQRHFNGPRFGYFGRIDARIDFRLLTALADRHPGSHVVMVGPLDGIDESRLPRRANLHWLGAQPYPRMAHFAASWDACLLPFALTAANRWVCATPVLEYLAAEKPVIATTLPDVVRLFGNFIRVAASVDSFVLACGDAVAEDPALQYESALGARAMLSGLSWDRAAGRVRRLLERGAAVATAPVPQPAGRFERSAAAEARP